jgi:hypothetical protein
MRVWFHTDAGDTPFRGCGAFESVPKECCHTPTASSALCVNEAFEQSIAKHLESSSCL